MNAFRWRSQRRIKWRAVVVGFAAATVVSSGLWFFWLSERSEHGQKDIQQPKRNLEIGNFSAADTTYGTSSEGDPKQKTRISDEIKSKLLKDPIHFLADLKRSGVSQDELASFVSYAVLDKPELLKELIPMLTDPMSRQSALSHIVFNLSRRNRSALLSSISTLDGIVKNEALGFAITHFASAGLLEDAVNLQQAMPFSSHRNNAILRLAPQLAKRDPERALRWLDDLQPEGEMPIAADQLIKVFRENRDAHSLSKLLDKTTEGFRREMIVQNIVAIANERKDKEMMVYLNSQLDDVEKDYITVAELKFSEPHDAFLTQVGGIRSERKRLEMVGQYFGTRTAEMPAKWANVALNVPPAYRGIAIENVIASWLSVDTEAASEWVQSISSPRDRDFAVSAFARGINRVDKSAARTALSWISDEGIRKKTESQIK